MALSVTFSGIPTDAAKLYEQYRDSFKGMPEPVCVAYKENISALRDKLVDYHKYENILLVGNGGSIWSFMSYYTALCDRINGKTVVPLTDMEPDNLEIIRQKYTPESTLVIIISKSGSTVGVIEDLIFFADYPKLFVTDPEGSLAKIAAYYQSPVIVHPAVGGRYSGFTSSAYVPAILTDLPVEDIEQGAREGYEKYGNIGDKDNVALQTALVLFELEEKGIHELFVPIYSNFLQTFGLQIMQLFHESFGKEGKGITVVAAQAPESQHHTNQRFFGGQKNMAGCFIHVLNQRTNDLTIKVPAEIHNVALRSGTLKDIDGINLADSFVSEYEGTVTDAKNNAIPVIDVAVSQVNGKTVGELMAFWHYVTIYSSILRGVDPYDQPQVESSKVISFETRKQGLASDHRQAKKIE